MKHFRHKDDSVRLIASDETWIDGEAVRQLEETRKLPGIFLAIGLPDLHPGRGVPVGVAFVSRGIIYPHLAGSDLGCGIGLWVTGVRRNSVNLDRVLKKLEQIKGSFAEDNKLWNPSSGLTNSEHDRLLGTIGRGNHFCELQAVEDVRDESEFDTLGLSEKNLTLLVHTGSRSLGESIWSRYVGAHGNRGLAEGSEDASTYVCEHDKAVQWAELNRTLVAYRFLLALGTDGQRVLDLPHNMIVQNSEANWIHRKGAAPSDRGAVMIPGSRGTLSYLVSPIGDQSANAYSVAQGAGLKWSRSQCDQRLRSRFAPDDLLRSDVGGRVIYDGKGLLYNEAPPAYKQIGRIVQDLVDANLIRVIATFRPLLTHKTSGTT